VQETHRSEKCGRYSIGLHAQNGNAHRFLAVQTRCKSWDCPYCAKIKADGYKERMKKLFDGRPLFLYTLTYFHNKPPEEVWKNYSVAWNRIRTAINKKYGSFAYVRVLESHTVSPYPHLHVIADVHVPERWFGQELLSAGFGYQADMKPITSVGAVFYVSKYLTKGWSNEQSKNIRKDLRLRIISFGGFDSSRVNTGELWNIVARDSDFNTVTESIDNSAQWSFGVKATKTFERRFDGYYESTYIVEEEPTHGWKMLAQLPLLQVHAQAGMS
jgi:hypothetical protein